MKLITRTPVAFALLVTSFALPTADAAPTPAEQTKLRMHTSLPKKSGESLFSYTAEWRQDEGGKLYHSTGMSFLDADKATEASSAARITKKLATSMHDSMIRLDPVWRGIVVEQSPEQTLMTLSNKAGYALTSLVFRDYTNQALRFDLADKSFNAQQVQVAFDVVLAADVEYLDKFSGQKSRTAGHGEIAISLDEQPAIHIKTDGKTTREIETEVSRQLSGAKLADISLVTSQIGKDTRNIKPFDGAEIQFSNLAAKAVAIDVNDPSLGVLVKFKFKDEAAPAINSESSFMLMVLGLLGLLAAVYYWRLKKS